MMWVSLMIILDKIRYFRQKITHLNELGRIVFSF
jgi:hypothetical protein